MQRRQIHHLLVLVSYFYSVNGRISWLHQQQQARMDEEPAGDWIQHPSSVILWVHCIARIHLRNRTHVIAISLNLKLSMAFFLLLALALSGNPVNLTISTYLKGDLYFTACWLAWK
jgi:hypothetical protein